MSRYALPGLLFLGHVAVVAAATAVLLMFTDWSRKPSATAQQGTGSVDVSPSDKPPPPPDILLDPPEGNGPSPTQNDSRLRPAESASESAPETPAAPAPAVPPPDSAPDAAAPAGPAVQLPSDDQEAALEQLVVQSQQENEQLRVIDKQLATERQQVAHDESQRQSEAEQQGARHAATLAALGTLRQAEVRLASGNSDGVDHELANAEAALSGRTRLDVEASREAIARGDLFEAGLYLAGALAERRAPR
jgi:hypothetical protein